MEEQRELRWTELNPACLLRRVLRELPVILAAGLTALLLRQYMHNTEIAVTMRLSTILKTIKQPL